MTRHFGGGLRSYALKRAYALGHRGKNTCAICGKTIYNRMMHHPAYDNPTAGVYAHQSCAKTQPQHEWGRAW